MQNKVNILFVNKFKKSKKCLPNFWEPKNVILDENDSL